MTSIKENINPANKQVGNAQSSIPNKCPFRDDGGILPICLFKEVGTMPSLKIIRNIKHRCSYVRLKIEGKKRKIIINNFITR